MKLKDLMKRPSSQASQMGKKKFDMPKKPAAPSKPMAPKKGY